MSAALVRLLRRTRRLVNPDARADDSTLLAKWIVHSDQDAFELLLWRHGPMVWDTCRRVLRHEQDAEDAFQATFLVLARKASSIRQTSSLAGWLYRVAHRAALAARSRCNRVEMRNDLDEVGAAPSDGAEWSSYLDEELGRLPERYRQPFVLCCLQGLTTDEAAELLRCPRGTVATRVAWARRRLRERLSRELPARMFSGCIPACLVESALRTAGGASVLQPVAEISREVMTMLFRTKIKTIAALLAPLLLILAGLGGLSIIGKDTPPSLLRSVKSGPWSDPATWEGGKVPGAGARVQIHTGHTVTYDRNADEVIRSIHVAGTLAFARDKDTRLDVGLIKIQAGEDATEHGFDCDAHAGKPEPGKPRPVLEVGTPDQPIPAKHTALIRLAYVNGLDKQSCPAIVCCGGRMDFHGAPLSRSWVKLGATAKKQAKVLTLAEPVSGWKVGDRIIVTATGMSPLAGTPVAVPDPKGTTTEERSIQGIDGAKLTLNAPLEFEHLGTGLYRGEVANLSRNVIVESADPKGERGHTMYHKHSAGAISYAEFRHLGKEGVLGRYSLHYHLVGDTMRGSYVIGASIWDSANRWLAIHGTNYLVVRDNVGYRSKGHGFFLEDGSEVYNVLDRNLAVGARPSKPLPKQMLQFDHNDGAGFWWANARNTFTRNVAVENGLYGFRYEALVPLLLPIQQPDGASKKVDVRTLPFVRFDDNESHSQTGNYGAKLDIANIDGHGIADGVGPDVKHPFIVRNLLIWHVHYGFNTGIPSLLIDGLRLHQTHYGYLVGNCDSHVYRNITLSGQHFFPLTVWPVKQNGNLRLTVDGLTFEGFPEDRFKKASEAGYGLIYINEDGAAEKAAHFRNVTPAIVPVHVGPYHYKYVSSAKVMPPHEVVPVYLHDKFGPGRHAKVVSTASKDYAGDGLKYREEAPFSPIVRVAEVNKVTFPKLLDPIDDLPPTTVITHVRKLPDGKVLVRGTTADNGTVKRVVVNGKEARPVVANFAEWEITLDGSSSGAARLKASAEDTAGNVEKNPHVWK